MIEAHHLSKIYRRGLYALRDLSLTIEHGEFVFLTGPSGAGKSTLLRLLLRQELASEGELVVDGEHLSDLTPSQVQAYRRSIGFVFQDFKLILRKTVLENVAFVPRVLGASPSQQRRKTFQVLKWVGLQHRMNALPMELSGGEQQRVAIARAVAKRPAVLLCDEPTGALDFETGVRVLEVIEATNRELSTTTAVITHNAAIAGMADRVVRMRSGRITEVLHNEQRMSPDTLAW